MTLVVDAVTVDHLADVTALLAVAPILHLAVAEAIILPVRTIAASVTMTGVTETALEARMIGIAR